MTLAGQRVIVSGGAGDIGSAIAAALAGRPAEVRVLDLVGEPEFWDARPELRDGPGGVSYAQVDVTDPVAVGEAVDRFPRPTVAVCCAGLNRPRAFTDITPEDWNLTVDVNLTGSFYLAQAAARAMKAAGSGGQIWLIGSWVQDVAFPTLAPYSAAKAGLVARHAAPHASSPRTVSA